MFFLAARHIYNQYKDTLDKFADDDNWDSMISQGSLVDRQPIKLKPSKKKEKWEEQKKGCKC